MKAPRPTKTKKTTSHNLEVLHKEKIRPLLRDAPWVLRITQYKGKPLPMMILKERKEIAEKGEKNPSRKKLVDRGTLYGPSQKRCLPMIRSILSTVQNELGIGMDLHHFLDTDLLFRGNLPLHSEGGYKLALLFKLQERVQDMDRVELIARRLHRFTTEEAAYWWSRLYEFDAISNRWAQSGMRIILGGTSDDKKGIAAMLEKLRLERLEV
ncbi:MAG TPA: hypothetical protein PLW97_11695 [Synergistaceae bacterium]|nr:hypothetical protein [Synergistaceae bacterium]